MAYQLNELRDSCTRSRSYPMVKRAPKTGMGQAGQRVLE